MAGDLAVFSALPVEIKLLPSDNVPVHGDFPVNVKVRFAAWPEQIVVLPLRTPVGLDLIVTFAVPLRSAARALQLASISDPMVKVVVAAGVTLTWIGLLLPLNGVLFIRVPLQGPLPVTAISNITG